MKILQGICLTLLTSICMAAAIDSSTNWYDDFLFKDKSFNFEFIRTLGYAYSGGADLGEAVATARNIKDGDFESWYQEWLKTGARIDSVAEKMRAQKHNLSAMEASLRASNYFRTAGFYMDAPENREKSIQASSKSKSSFIKAIVSLPYLKPIKIPYENTTLPGYFLQAKTKQAPLLIINTGFDGTAEELYFEAGKAAYERGYNVLLVEGPGQGEVLRQQKIPMRYDWEKVVTPVINFAETLPNINKEKIALLGISLGGYLAARAAAFDKRIKACIVNGGIYDASEGVYKSLPPDLIKLLETDPEEFNKIMYDEMKKGGMIGWYFNHAMWVYNAKSPADVMHIVKQYTLKDVVSNITCTMLVVNSEADMFDKEQAKKLFALLKSPKKYLEFTREESAQAHCQMGAIAISNARIFNWLDDVFNR